MQQKHDGTLSVQRSLENSRDPSRDLKSDWKELSLYLRHSVWLGPGELCAVLRKHCWIRWASQIHIHQKLC